MIPMRASFYGACLMAGVGIYLPPGAASAAGDCTALVTAGKADWRWLTHGSHVAPSMRINTSDGRHFTGSQLNYAGAVIARAESACDASRENEFTAAMMEFRTVLQTVPTATATRQ
jgi:hypothetical protein